MLGKFEWEVLEYMPPDEFARWLALLEVEAQDQKRAKARAEAKARAQRR